MAVSRPAGFAADPAAATGMRIAIGRLSGTSVDRVRVTLRTTVRRLGGGVGRRLGSKSLFVTFLIRLPASRLRAVGETLATATVPYVTYVVNEVLTEQQGSLAEPWVVDALAITVQGRGQSSAAPAAAEPPAAGLAAASWYVLGAGMLAVLFVLAASVCCCCYYYRHRHETAEESVDRVGQKLTGEVDKDAKREQSIDGRKDAAVWDTPGLEYDEAGVWKLEDRPGFGGATASGRLMDSALDIRDHGRASGKPILPRLALEAAGDPFQDFGAAAPVKVDEPLELKQVGVHVQLEGGMEGGAERGSGSLLGFGCCSVRRPCLGASPADGCCTRGPDLPYW